MVELTRDSLPGFVAWDATNVSPGMAAELAGVESVTAGSIRLSHWGLASIGGRSAEFLVSRVRRRTSGSIADHEIREIIRQDPRALMELLPPFAAAATLDDGVVMLADAMGFRPLFHSDPNRAGVGLMSTSALLAGRIRSGGLDEVAVAVQSLLGWQLGGRTLVEGVSKLAPGAIARLDTSGVNIMGQQVAATEPISFDRAVAHAAEILRVSMNALLDDHPDAVLQLTGGLDSRLLLSAVPPARRKGMHAMTLGVPGSADVAIASQICARYGLRHEVRGLSELGALDPAEAWDLCRSAAVRLDGMSDPVALAALGVAERGFAQGVRISGLGGEVARGFYYSGRVQDRTYGRKDAEHLADWRMFVNEAVEPGLLNGDFSAWAREVANAEVYKALRSGGDEWFRSTDSLYLHHRMQRWAGATDTAVGHQRIVVNPMLDRGFIDICTRLRPVDKARSRFLASLQMELDPELGNLPLDGRPSPSIYAQPSWSSSVTQAFQTGTRFARKANQRIRRKNRSPAGGDILAGKVVEWWRESAQQLELLQQVEFLRADWLGEVLSGRREARASTVGFLASLIAVLDTTAT